MPANESIVQIPAAPTASPAAAPVGIRTFAVKDPLTGALVQIQGVVLCDDSGEPYTPMSEETGREIVKALIALNNVMVQFTGFGTMSDSVSGDGS